MNPGWKPPTQDTDDADEKTVTKAIPKLDPELSGNPSIFLSDEMMSKMYMMHPTTSKMSRITNQVWNAMKLDSAKGDDSGDDANGWD